jgi:hypothetical protein
VHCTQSAPSSPLGVGRFFPSPHSPPQRELSAAAHAPGMQPRSLPPAFLRGIRVVSSVLTIRPGIPRSFRWSLLLPVPPFRVHTVARGHGSGITPPPPASSSCWLLRRRYGAARAEPKSTMCPKTMRGEITVENTSTSTSAPLKFQYLVRWY